MIVATMERRISVWLMGLLSGATGGLSGLELKKMADERIAVIPSADNGASLLWCFGSIVGAVFDGRNYEMRYLGFEIE